MNAANSKRKILAIDDSLMLLSFVKDILSQAGYEVATAATSSEGFKAAISDKPDLILLDYVLPGMKGEELVREFSQNPALAKVPVVYMSGLGAELRPESASMPNVIGFLNKPFTSDLLIKTVETHMPQPSEEPEVQPEAPMAGARGSSRRRKRKFLRAKPRRSSICHRRTGAERGPSVHAPSKRKQTSSRWRTREPQTFAEPVANRSGRALNLRRQLKKNGGARLNRRRTGRSRHPPTWPTLRFPKPFRSPTKASCLPNRPPAALFLR